MTEKLSRIPIRTDSDLHVQGKSTFLDENKYGALNEWSSALRSLLYSSKIDRKSVALSGQQYAAMLEIECHAGAEPITVGSLAARLMVRHNTAVQLVKGLAALGYLDRTQSTQDRRRVHLLLTKTGIAVLDKLVRAEMHALDRIRPTLARTLKLQLDAGPQSPGVRASQQTAA